MDLLQDARALSPEITELRHRLHRRPEVGLHLPQTQATVLDELDGLGLEITPGRSCSSVSAVLRGGSAAAGRPAVLLRADMDALPVQEEAEVPFRSELDGVMHACGHDLHTAMLIGAARLLAAHRDELAGDVLLLFQPGEEGFDGAGQMIADGALDLAGARPKAAFALHVMSNLTPTGRVATRPGPIMAASDGLFVTVRGRGGHGSAPHAARDPIPAACEMVLALQTAMTRNLSPFADAVLTVGVLRAGTRRNVIPETASFEATVRTFDGAVRAVIAEESERICRGVAQAHGLDVEIRYEQEYPVTINDPTETAFALGVVDTLLGNGLLLADPLTGSEDFSRFLAHVPGVMLFVGATPDTVDHALAPANHSPRVTFDDAVLPDGIALYASLAARRLELLAARG